MTINEYKEQAKSSKIPDPSPTGINIMKALGKTKVLEKLITTATKQISHTPEEFESSTKPILQEWNAVTNHLSIIAKETIYNKRTRDIQRNLEIMQQVNIPSRAKNNYHKLQRSLNKHDQTLKSKTNMEWKKQNLDLKINVETKCLSCNNKTTHTRTSDIINLDDELHQSFTKITTDWCMKCNKPTTMQRMCKLKKIGPVVCLLVSSDIKQNQVITRNRILNCEKLRNKLRNYTLKSVISTHEKQADNIKQKNNYLSSRKITQNKYTT